MRRPALPIVLALALALVLCSSTEAVGQIWERVFPGDSLPGVYFQDPLPQL